MDLIILATFLQEECMEQENTTGPIQDIGLRENTRITSEMAKGHTTIIIMSMSLVSGEAEYC